MSDPIEQLARFGAGFEGGPMLPPDEIRRRGDRRRRRTTALVAAGSLAVVAAIAAPVVALTTGGDGSDVEPAPAPTTVADPAVALSEADLLSDEETVLNGFAEWHTVDTFAGDGQSVFHPCATRSLTGRGAGAVFQRGWELRSPDGPVVEGARMSEAVAEFPDAGAARDAFSAIAAEVRDCEERIPESDSYDLGAEAPVDLPVDGEALLLSATYGPVPASIDPFGDMAFFTETGLVVSGDRIAVVHLSQAGQDYNYPDGTPMEQMLPRAAQRLQPGGEAPPPAEAQSIPDGFPLDTDVMRGSEFEQTGPAPDAPGVAGIDACGESLWPPAGTLDRLAVNVSGPEHGDNRELVTFPSPEEAAAVVTRIVVALESCPQQPVDGGGTIRWQTFDDRPVSTTFGYTYADGLGGSLFTVAQLGTAVVVVEQAGEWSPETMAGAVSDRADLVRILTDEMCAFTEAGC